MNVVTKLKVSLEIRIVLASLATIGFKEGLCFIEAAYLTRFFNCSVHLELSDCVILSYCFVRYCNGMWVLKDLS